MRLHEDSWDAFPRSKTVITNPFLGDRFEFTIESMHYDNDDGQRENVLDLPDEILKKRVVQHIDICTDVLENKEFRLDEKSDPAKVKSTLSGLGPLKPGWKDTCNRKMCAYKTVTIKVLD